MWSCSIQSKMGLQVMLGQPVEAINACVHAVCECSGLRPSQINVCSYQLLQDLLHSDLLPNLHMLPSN